MHKFSISSPNMLDLGISMKDSLALVNRKLHDIF